MPVPFKIALTLCVVWFIFKKYGDGCSMSELRSARYAYAVAGLSALSAFAFALYGLWVTVD